MNKNSRLSLGVFFLTTTLVHAPAVNAQTFTWDCGSSFWDINSCWSPAGLPTAASTVIVGTPVTVSIDNITGAAVAKDLLIGGSGTISLIQSGGSLSVSNQLVGSSGTGTFNLQAGTHNVATALRIGNTTGSNGVYNQTGGILNAGLIQLGLQASQGTATVSGTNDQNDGRWNITGTTFLGQSDSNGTGTLTINTGGTVQTGGLQVRNANSSLSTLGGGVLISSGGLSLTNGGQASSIWGSVDSALARFADNSIVTNAATIGGAGTGSRWNVTNLIVGRNGSGTLNVNAGGRVDATGRAFIGEFANSAGNVIVGGTGATFEVGTGGLYLGGNDVVGNGGVGNLTANGGGFAHILGNATVWNAGSSILASGSGGIIDVEGTMTIRGGGTATSFRGVVENSGPRYTGGLHATNALITGENSSWNVSDFLSIGKAGAGSATVASGGTVASDTVQIGQFSGSSGILRVNAGGAVDTDGAAEIGSFSGASGTVLVGGTGALWDIGQGLAVGGRASGGGSGTLTVSSGGAVNVAGLTIWNSNSIISTGATSATDGGQINVGGALSIRGGGTANSGIARVDSAETGDGNVIEAQSATVRDAGSRWDAGVLVVGTGGQGTLTVAAGGTFSSSSYTRVGLGNGSNGLLNIDAGGTVNTGGDGFLGQSFFGSAPIGLATVDGANARWNIAGNLELGRDFFGGLGGGRGTLTVGSGGRVSAANLTIWNSVSSIATGTTASTAGGAIDVAGALIISGGGTATSRLGTIDNSAGAAANTIRAGSATIGGFNSRWDTESFIVGAAGAGTTTVESSGTLASSRDTVVGSGNASNGVLNVNAGGTVDTNLHALIGLNSSATGMATVSGTNALWDITKELTIGDSGTGTLAVANGGRVVSGGPTYIGRRSGSSGILTINAGGTFDTSRAFIAGAGATGQVTVDGVGALMEVTDTVTIGTFGSGNGSLTVNTGGVVNARSLTTQNGTSTLATGTLLATAGGQINLDGGLNLFGGGRATSYLGFVDTIASDFANSIDAQTASVSGGGSRWDTRLLEVGSLGMGTATVASGGLITSQSNTYVGRYGGSDGALNINAGGALDTGSSAFIGLGDGATGAAAVSGIDAHWDIAISLFVGSDGAGFLTVANGGTVTTGQGSAIVGDGNGGVGDMLIGAGGTVNTAANAFLGRLIGSQGSATVSGANALWDTALNVVVGSEGAGSLTVANGGMVISDLNTSVGASNGSVGSLTINGGGTVDTRSSAFIGRSTGASGGATVAGADALWTIAGDLVVGGSASAPGGMGTLGLKDGGTVNANAVKLWSTGAISVDGGNLVTDSVETLSGGLLDIKRGVVAATGSSALFDLRGTTTLGPAGALIADAGTVNLAGTVSSGGALIAKNGGTINVSNNGIADNAVAKAEANGMLVIAAGANLRGGLIEADGASSVVDVQAGGTISSQPFVDATIQARNGGTLNVDGTVDGSVSIFNGGMLTGSGTIVEDVSNTNGGSFNVGNSPGVMTIEGDYSQDEFSTLTVELGGLIPGLEYDWVDVSGSATLAGELEVLWFDTGLGLFNAGLGDSFDLLTADSILGEFNGLNLAQLDSGLTWDLAYLADEIGSTDVLRLSVVAVSEVPLPAALWLFGSALAALVGAGFRRSGQSSSSLG